MEEIDAYTLHMHMYERSKYISTIWAFWNLIAIQVAHKKNDEQWIFKSCWLEMNEWIQRLVLLLLLLFISFSSHQDVNRTYFEPLKLYDGLLD